MSLPYTRTLFYKRDTSCLSCALSCAEELPAKRTRHTQIDSHLVRTTHDGQLTYCGPGLRIPVPRLTLDVIVVGIGDYVCRMQGKIWVAECHFRTHKHFPGYHGERLLPSIDLQVRHRLTTHGFAMDRDVDKDRQGGLWACGSKSGVC
ncbi:hypothetical protein EV401DRAFT_558515 [Pisolithus croceorrhizus]|nr:hypothetical protein EV401DRAFT_558515 [Pisolithus croceorrhizus]